MPDLDNIKTKTETLSGDNTKTQTTFEDTPNNNNKRVPMEVNAVTTSLPGDPTKSQTTITSAKSGKVNLRVVGPFNGSADVESGSVLKDVLPQFNKEDDTYGKYKYRDEEDKPVGLTAKIERDIILISVLKGN